MHKRQGYRQLLERVLPSLSPDTLSTKTYSAGSYTTKQENSVAKIPHSSQYRTSSNRASTSVGGSSRAGSARTGSATHTRAVEHLSITHWLLMLVALVLLIAFPYKVLGVIGLGLFVAWLFGKK